MRRTINTNALHCALLVVVCGGCMESPPGEPYARATEDIRVEAGARDASEPPLDQMKVARVSGKLSVPVDVRYRVGAVPEPGQTVAMDLAFVPRVQGQNLKVEFPHSDAVTIASGNVSFTQQKAGPEQVIRRSLLVTPKRREGAVVRILVSMNVEGSRFFGVFAVPVGE